MRETPGRLTPHRSDGTAADRTRLLAAGLELTPRLAELRRQAIDRVLLALLAITFLAVPVSTMRSVQTGWLPLYTLHLGVAATILLVAALRRRLSQSMKFAFILVVYWTIGVAGLFQLGLLSAGPWWLVMSALLTSLLYSVRAGMAVMFAALALLSLLAWAYVSGTLSPGVAPDVYVRSLTSWLTLAMGAFVMPMIMFAIIGMTKSTVVDLLHELEEQHRLVRRLATHDELTGAPTLTLARDRLEQALRNGRRGRPHVAVYFIDLDGFKAVNDSAGHEAGNEVLRAVVTRLRALLRPEDTVARLGGDEFLVILDRIENPADVAARAEALRAAVIEPIEFRGQSLRVGASIGIAIYPAHASDADGLIRQADAAMYEAKHAGKNCVRLATPAAADIGSDGSAASPVARRARPGGADIQSGPHGAARRAGSRR